MEIIPVGPPVVQIFQFFPDSEKVNVVFQDGKSQEFPGLDNLKMALTAVENSPLIVGDITLTEPDGESVIMVVPKNVASETIRTGTTL